MSNAKSPLVSGGFQECSWQFESSKQVQAVCFPRGSEQSFESRTPEAYSAGGPCQFAGDAALSVLITEIGGLVAHRARTQVVPVQGPKPAPFEGGPGKLESRHVPLTSPKTGLSVWSPFETN